MSWYSTGSVTLTHASAVVTGTGTNFNIGALAGYALVIAGEVYQIASVDSATQITLTAPWAGPTASAQAYAIMPTQSVARDLSQNVGDLLATFGPLRDGTITLSMLAGSATAPGLNFANDTTTGFYHPDTSQIGLTLNGTRAILFTPAAMTVSTPLVTTGTATIGSDIAITGGATIGGTLSVTGMVTAASFSGAFSGNATTATTLATARAIAIGGSGITAPAVNFDGSAAITLVATVDPKHITNARMVDVATQTFKGRNTTGSGSPEDLSVATVRTMLSIDQVENKSSTTILAGMTSANVTTALGFTPANKAGDTFTGAVTAPSFVGALTGNASTATKLATARTLGLTGKVTGSVSFDGTANAYVATTLALAAADITTPLGYTPANKAGDTFSGTVNASSFVGPLTGNASTATKLGTARTIALTGKITGTASFDGSANIAIATTSALSSSDIVTALGYTPAVGSGGTPSFTGLTIDGSGTSANLGIVFNGPTGDFSNSILLSKAGKTLWQTGYNAVDQSGSNVGADFFVSAFDDTGAAIGTALTITRASMQSLFANHVSATGGFQSRALGALGNFEAVNGSASAWYKAGLRNDGSTFYLLKTAVATTQAAAITATYDAARPLYVDLATGNVGIVTSGQTLAIGGATTINAPLTVSNLIQTTGGNAFQSNYNAIYSKFVTQSDSNVVFYVGGGSLGTVAPWSYNASGDGYLVLTNTRVSGALAINGSASATGSITAATTLNAPQVLTTSNNSGQNVKIGDDAWIGDVNLANGFAVRGVSNNAAGYITFGTGGGSIGSAAGTSDISVSGNLRVATYTYSNYFNQNSGSESFSPAYVYCDSGDGFHRKLPIAALSSATGSYAKTYIAGQSQYFRSNQNTSDGANNPPLMAYSDNNSGAIMAFLRNGNAGLLVGLDTDNVFRMGGWSFGNSLFQMDGSGNLTMLGNVTAYSDRRLKSDIRTFSDAMATVRKLRGVRFIKDGAPGIGVIAQELQEVLPELVVNGMGSNDLLSVAYGNITGILIEAAKETDAELDTAKSRIASLEDEVTDLRGMLYAAISRIETLEAAQ